jgi:hypothetical protein
MEAATMGSRTLLPVLILCPVIAIAATTKETRSCEGTIIQKDVDFGLSHEMVKSQFEIIETEVSPGVYSRKLTAQITTTSILEDGSLEKSENKYQSLSKKSVKYLDPETKLLLQQAHITGTQDGAPYTSHVVYSQKSKLNPQREEHLISENTVVEKQSSNRSTIYKSAVTVIPGKKGVDQELRQRSFESYSVTKDGDQELNSFDQATGWMESHDSIVIKTSESLGDHKTLEKESYSHPQVEKDENGRVVSTVLEFSNTCEVEKTEIK